MSALLNLTDQNFESEVLKSEIPVLVDFHATWCGPCKAIAPMLEELARDFEGRAKVVKCDIDVAPGVASSHGIMAVPTLIYFKGGSPVTTLRGGNRRKPELAKAFEDLL